MPADFIERWAQLRDLADALDDQAEKLLSGMPVEQSTPDGPLSGFHPKSEADYTAFISAAVQHRTRTHEKLLRLASEWLQAHGFTVANQHPKDLEITAPVRYRGGEGHASARSAARRERSRRSAARVQILHRST